MFQFLSGPLGVRQKIRTHDANNTQNDMIFPKISIKIINYKKTVCNLKSRINHSSLLCSPGPAMKAMFVLKVNSFLSKIEDDAETQTKLNRARINIQINLPGVLKHEVTM